jgi:drug/metabolite transporter (DMT)-like permease
MRWPKEAVASLAVFAAGVMWGVWWLPLRYLAGEGLAGVWPVLVIYAVSAAILLPTALPRGRRMAAAGPGLLFVGFCIGTALTGWSYAIIAGQVVRVSMLYYLAPIWATLLSIAWLGERPSALRALSIPLGLGGAAVILHVDSGFPIPRTLPEWIGLGAGVIFAVGATYQRARPEMSVHDRTFVTYVWATLVGLALMPFVPSPTPTSFLTWPIALTALVAAGLMAVPSYFLLFWGSRYVDSGRVNLLLIIEGVISTTTASIITDEPFGWHEALGCVLVIGAIAVEGVAQLAEVRVARARA